MSKIPVYYHIPKCGGTTVLTTLNYFNFKTNRKFYIDNDLEWDNRICQVLRVFLHEDRRLNCVVTFKNKFNDNTVYIDRHICSCDFKTFSKLYNNGELSIYAICVEPTGDANLKQSFDTVCLFFKENSDIDILPFTIFRNIFDRHYSEYMYLNSDMSKHEKSHGVFKDMTFEQYIESNIFPFNYICQTVQRKPSEENIEYIINFFKQFRILDMSNIIDNLFSILNECQPNKLDYSAVFSEQNITTNKNTYNKISLNNLSQKSQEIFLFKTSLDRKLYDAHISQT